jgi:flagellar basal-body rod protein FlgG
MNTSLYTSSVSMGAVQQKLDVLARNVANVNTTGYKRREASFDDILTSVLRQPRAFQLAGRSTPPGVVLGNGVRINEQQLFMRQGQLQQTGNLTDMAIVGEGFFEIELAEDPVENAQGVEVPRAAYTRDGSFKLSRNTVDTNFNFLTTSDGRFVRDVNDQPIQIPVDAKINIDQKGNISATLVNGNYVPEFAKLKVVRVTNSQLLENVGDNLFVLPRETGVNDPQYVQQVDYDSPVEDTVIIEQGYLEISNVNLSQEMTELLNTQRAFQLLSRSLSTADTMMGLANNLRA